MRSLVAVCLASLAVAACNNLVTGAADTCSGAAANVSATNGPAFSPANVTIVNGQSVCWHNTGTLEHSVTSNDNTSFNAASLTGGQTFVHVFALPGSFPYHCRFHAGMTGVITVN
jgi:plastocyanin